MKCSDCKHICFNPDNYHKFYCGMTSTGIMAKDADIECSMFEERKIHPFQHVCLYCIHRRPWRMFIADRKCYCEVTKECVDDFFCTERNCPHFFYDNQDCYGEVTFKVRDVL